MIFGRFSLDDALGTVLAHSHRLADRVLKKGVVLDASAIDALRLAGRLEVIAARLEPGDVAENESADRLAQAFDAPHLSRRRAATGRSNLHAERDGVLRVDGAVVDAVNLASEALTVGTLADYAVVAAGDMVATIKVIPFAVPGAVLDQARRLALAGPALRLHPFRPFVVGLVVCELPGLKQSVIDGTIMATAGRVAALGGTLMPALRCVHAEAPIADSLLRLQESGAELLLVAGASATVDRRDVGPAGVVAAGGEIVHFGMPVDPGNLICVGRIGGRYALVLPGCARSPKLNGIDWVLQRIFAGLPLEAADIMRMGVGGLLQDTRARPLPRAKAVAAPATVAAVVLAAGMSSRMAPLNKLLVAGADGKTMLARVVDAVLSSRARPVIVVTGHRAAEIQAALAGRPVTFVQAVDFADGLSASLKAGVAAVPAGVAAAVVCLGDMPMVTGRMIDRVIDAHVDRAIVVPTHAGAGGNPVLWDRIYFKDIMGLAGDAGARSLLRSYPDRVVEVELGDDAVVRDFDTVDSLAGLPRKFRPV